MATVGEREIEREVFLSARARLGRLDRDQQIEVASVMIRRHAAALGRVFWHEGIAATLPSGSAQNLHVYKMTRFTVREDQIEAASLACIDVIGSHEPPVASELCRFGLRCLRQARRRARLQAFFHRHPSFRPFRRFFLGRKAVLRWV